MKILMIAYPFPPYGGMSQRTVYFANYLADKGHKVDVIAAMPSSHFHGYDEGLVSLISDKVQVHRTFAGTLHHLRYHIKRINKKLGRDDSGIALKIDKILSPFSTAEWLPVGFLRSIRPCRNNDYDLVYCHGDPYVANVLALMLEKIFKVPWVMYVGDPRYFGTYSSYKRVLKHLENACLKSASSIIVNCPETRDGYLRHFPKTERKKYHVITDGFDRRRFAEITGEPSEKFRIVYTGVFYNSVREPVELFKALGSLAGEGLEDIETVIAGEEAGRYRKIIGDQGLEGSVRFLGHQPHDKVISLQKGATVLLLIGWSGGYQVPGKLFEYFAARKPVLVISYDGDDVAAKMVNRQRRGLVVNNRADEIREALIKLHGLWKGNELDQSFDLEELTEYTWERLAGNLEQVLKATAAS